MMRFVLSGKQMRSDFCIMKSKPSLIWPNSGGREGRNINAYESPPDGGFPWFLHPSTLRTRESHRFIPCCHQNLHNHISIFPVFNTLTVVPNLFENGGKSRKRVWSLLPLFSLHSTHTPPCCSPSYNPRVLPLPSPSLSMKHLRSTEITTISKRIININKQQEHSLQSTIHLSHVWQKTPRTYIILLLSFF